MSKSDEVTQIFSSIFSPGKKQNNSSPFLMSSKNIPELIKNLISQKKSVEQKIDILITLLGYFKLMRI